MALDSITESCSFALRQLQFQSHKRLAVELLEAEILTLQSPAKPPDGAQTPLISETLTIHTEFSQLVMIET